MARLLRYGERAISLKANIRMQRIPQLRVRPDRRNHASREQLLDGVRAEFTAMPSLRLTCAQVRRLFGLRVDICERVLTTLVDDGTLVRGTDARFSIAADTDSPRSRYRVQQ